MFPFNNGQANPIAERHFKRIAAIRQAEIDNAELQRKENEKIEQLKSAAKAESDRLANVVKLNRDAILALQTGTLEPIIELFDKLKAEDRELFNAASPLLQALDKQNFPMAEYLLTKGFSCDVWEDYVEEEQQPELAASLRAALAKPAANRLSM